LKRIFYLLFLLVITNRVDAQIDNNFWFVAPEVSSNHGDRPIFVRIATMSDTANIVFRMPASLSFVPITQKINPNSTFSINLTPWIDSIENKPADKVLTRGLQLTSDNNITAYYEVADQNNPAVSSFKGKNALGTEFYISGQTDYPNQTNDGSEAFDIVATEDNTHVWITPNLAIVGHAKGATFQVILNKGQTYSARTLDITAPASLAGSHVVSDKPIAITLLDDSIVTGGWDEIADQTIPINLLGWDYIVIKGFADNVAGNNDEHVYILATHDNTDIYLDGSVVPATNLNTGAQYDYPIPTANGTVKIKATYPVYVYHLSGHSGEAGSAIIPQDSCTGSRQVGFYRTSTYDFALLILTRNGNQGSFLMNGDPTIIQASDFTVVPGSNNSWVYYRKNLLPIAQVPVGGNIITNTSGKFHLGILNKISTGSSEYGYFSDFSSLYLGADKMMCPGDSTILDGGMDRTSYQWKTLINGVWTNIDTTRFLHVHDSGYYAVVTDGDFCELRDTIHIGVYSKPTINLGPDTTLCQNASITLDPGAFNSYHWQNGFIGRQFTTNTAGLYWVEVTDNNGCKARDTIIISIDSLPQTNGSIIGAPSVCQGQNGAVFSVNPFPFTATYSWTLPTGATGASTTNSISLDFNITAASDTIQVRGHNTCGFGPQIKLPVIVNPLPGPANPVTGPPGMCAGQTGSVFSVLPIADATSYTWSFPAGVSIVSGNGTNTVTVAASLAAVSGNITVMGTNACGNGSPSSFPLTIYTLPVPGITGPATVCQNSTQIYSTETGMSAYSWNIPPAGIIQSGAGTNSITILWTTTGTFTISVSYTDSHNCSALTPTNYTVTVTTLPLPTLTGPTLVCINTPETYTTETGMSNYSWSVSAGGTIVSGGTATDATVTISWNVSGTETVHVNYFAGTGCTAGTPTPLSVTVKQSPVISNAGNSSVCNTGTTNVILQSNPAGSVFSWTASGSSPNVTGFSASSGPFIIQTLQNSGFSTETVTYSVTPTLNGCGGTPSDYIVTVFPSPDVYFNPAGQSLCSGISTSIKLDSHVTGASFTWTATAASGNLNGFGPGSGTTVSQVINNTGIFTDSVTYLVSPLANLCPGIPGSFKIKVFPLPSVSFTVCNDMVTTTAAAPFTLKGGIPIGGVYSGAGIIAGIFYPNLAGVGTITHNYSYTNTYGCIATANHTITIINPPAFNCGDMLTDPRDGQFYPTVKLGTQCWMAANLDYGSVISSSQFPMDNCIPEKYCFNNNPSNCTSWGGLYTWDELMQYNDTPAPQGFCPPGWHVPVDNEWNTLFSQFINNGFAGSPLKYSGYSGFNALLEGVRFKYTVWGFDNFATLIWTSTSYGPEKAWAHGMNSENPSVSLYPASRSNAFVVRCIQN
jgi:uncharacterized protein (TIGR02145 family)